MIPGAARPLGIMIQLVAILQHRHPRIRRNALKTGDFFMVLCAGPPHPAFLLIRNDIPFFHVILNPSLCQGRGFFILTLSTKYALSLLRHTAPTEGTKLVNQAIIYEDTEGNAVTFPAPSVEVNCGIIINPEPCPAPVDITVESCQDSLTADLGNTYMESLGRIVQLDVTVKNVCPGKRVALGIILTETDRNGQEHSRGMKAITISAHNAPSCRDVTVKCVRFVLPEDLNVSGGSSCSLCSKRNLKVRLIAHNIDTGFQCCGTLTATL